MLSRRAFFLSTIATSVATTLARSQTEPGAKTEASNAPPTVLRLERRGIEVNGKSSSVFKISQPDGTSGIVTRRGARFRVRVENNIGEPSLIHWHGLTPPWQQDGVPGVSGPPIPAGQSADYDFPLRFGGTFWMHSHQGLQEQLLMAAPLIIHDQRDRPNEQEIVLMLADFSFTPPEEIFATLRKGSKMPAMAGMPPAGSAGTDGSKGAGMTMASAKPDLNDVKYDAFLANDRTLADPEVVKIEPLRHRNRKALRGDRRDLEPIDGDQFTFKLAQVDMKGAHRRAVDDAQQHPSAGLDLHHFGIGERSVVGQERVIFHVV